MNANRLLEIIDATNYDARSYSGRGMYGQRCVAVTVDGDVLDWFSSAIEECADLREAALLVRYARSDSMGLGTIIYWPRIDWPQDRTADEED